MIDRRRSYTYLQLSIWLGVKEVLNLPNLTIGGEKEDSFSYSL